MSDDFRKLIKEIESEAKAEGPAAEAELRDLRREFSIADQLLTLRREQELTQEQLAKKSGIPQSDNWDQRHRRRRNARGQRPPTG